MQALTVEMVRCSYIAQVSNRMLWIEVEQQIVILVAI